MRHLALAPVLALLASLLTALTLAGPAHAVDMDCGDFASQKSAQIWFLNHGGPQSDPSGLDYDSDGIACESNPCPCYYKKTAPDGSVSTAPKQVVQFGRIVKVVDGDTVDVRLKAGAKKRVRLVGIDTPEVYGGVECGGPQASRALHRKLPVGKRVKLVSDPSQDLKDRYGRLLRYVIRRSDAKDMNRSQVNDGWARVYVYHHNPFNRVASYRSAQRAAKAAPRGVWKVC
jgi:endonuclease YncB( thermonuclease family)